MSDDRESLRARAREALVRANALSHRGDAGAAADVTAEAVALLRSMGDDAPAADLAGALANLAGSLRDAGRTEEARDAAWQAIEAARRGDLLPVDALRVGRRRSRCGARTPRPRWASSARWWRSSRSWRRSSREWPTSCRTKPSTWRCA